MTTLYSMAKEWGKGISNQDSFSPELGTSYAAFIEQYKNPKWNLGGCLLANIHDYFPAIWNKIPAKCRLNIGDTVRIRSNLPVGTVGESGITCYEHFAEHEEELASVLDIAPERNKCFLDNGLIVDLAWIQYPIITKSNS